jgi:hypothetical protein
VLVALAKAGQVFKYSPARGLAYSTLKQDFHDTIAALLCGEDCGVEDEEGKRSVKIAALEVIAQGSQLGPEVCRKIMAAQHGITTLVQIVKLEDPRQRMPQRAAQALLHLCKSENCITEVAGQQLYRHVGELLEVAASTSHAELENQVVELIDEVHYSLRPAEVETDHLA